MRKKITVVGAGNVGRETAAWIAMKELGDVVLWNRSPERAKGNALDVMEAAPVAGFDANIVGTSDLKQTKGSDIIVFTAGAPRKPGMKREELVQGNAEVIVPLVKKLARLSPKAILVMVTNPLDAMTYAAFKASGFPKKRVVGMAGMLDASRFKSFIAEELGVSIEDIAAVVMGTHGESMVPVPRLVTVGGVPLTDLLSAKKIDKIVQRTKDAGAEIVGLLQANASFSVGAAAANLVESIVKDQKQVVPCSVFVQGEYGLRNLFVGLPAVIGGEGVEKIIEVKLSAKEKKQLHEAAKQITVMNKAIGFK